MRNALIVSWGCCIGVLFGVPPAFGAYELGLPWLPYGVGVVVSGLVVGFLIAFTGAAFFPHEVEPPQDMRPLITRGRLAQGKASLDRLTATGSSKTLQSQIVWRELQELERQEAEEPMSSIRRGESSDRGWVDFGRE
ncbi:MAG TPA: hypothetical protein VGL72_20460 [Bryobacteraceae bacterium]